MFKLKSKLIVAVMVMFGITAFLSCEKEVIVNEVPNQDESNLGNKIGEYHNIALDLYYNNSRLKSSEMSYKNVREEIIASLTNYNSELFNDAQINEYALQSEKVLSKLKISFSLKNTKSITDNFLELINYLEQNNEISTELTNQLKNINSNVLEGNLNSSEILDLVNDLNNSSWSEQDAKYVDAFTQVYNSSYEYWTNAKNLKSTKAEGDAVIVADAAGALYGMILGPVWSIIEGAIFSVIANNQ
ncbi:MAG: hypothetical protein KGY74_09935 [Candidatus Cloacimonetes bacterium]|nr:hypothetical protein [Candidatus Cloacimonadota bacterium]